MTNIVAFKKGGTDEARRREGMQEAGGEINDWMKNADNDPEDFFDDLFSGLKNSHDVRIERGGQFPEVKDNGKKFKFEFGGDDYFLRVTCEEDADWQSKNKKNVRMTIPVPQERGDLLGGGYADNILSDLKHFLVTEQDDAKAMKYLLAVIFLNRCQ